VSPQLYDCAKVGNKTDGSILSTRDTSATGGVLYNFTQLTNHFPHNAYYGPAPTNPTFTQRYILDDTYYKPGGPVYVLMGGETSALSRAAFLRTGIVAELAAATGGMALILEHRYYGQSWPVPNLSTDNLRWLTTEQSIADVPYFAQHVSFPGYEDKNLTAPGTPWILCKSSSLRLALISKAYTRNT